MPVAGGVQRVPGGVDKPAVERPDDLDLRVWSRPRGASSIPRLGSFQIDQKLTRGSGVERPAGCSGRCSGSRPRARTARTRSADGRHSGCVAGVGRPLARAQPGWRRHEVEISRCRGPWHRGRSCRTGPSWRPGRRRDRWRRTPAWCREVGSGRDVGPVHVDVDRVDAERFSASSVRRDLARSGSLAGVNIDSGPDAIGVQRRQRPAAELPHADSTDGQRERGEGDREPGQAPAEAARAYRRRQARRTTITLVVRRGVAAVHGSVPLRRSGDPDVHSGRMLLPARTGAAAVARTDRPSRAAWSSRPRRGSLVGSRSSRRCCASPPSPVRATGSTSPRRSTSCISSFGGDAAARGAHHRVEPAAVLRGRLAVGEAVRHRRGWGCGRCRRCSESPSYR